jgi:hypothetical protein
MACLKELVGKDESTIISRLLFLGSAEGETEF